MAVRLTARTGDVATLPRGLALMLGRFALYGVVGVVSASGLKTFGPAFVDYLLGWRAVQFLVFEVAAPALGALGSP